MYASLLFFPAVCALLVLSVPMLVTAVQALKADRDALEARLLALEA